MADHDVEGQLHILLQIWLSPGWVDLWTASGCEIISFERLGLEDDAADALVWQRCQEEGVLLVTGNRNADGEGSLEHTIRQRNAPTCLPVLTISDPDRLSRDRNYAEDVAAQLLDYVRDIEVVLGSGRLYLP